MRGNTAQDCSKLLKAGALQVRVAGSMDFLEAKG